MFKLFSNNSSWEFISHLVTTTNCCLTVVCYCWLKKVSPVVVTCGELRSLPGSSGWSLGSDWHYKYHKTVCFCCLRNRTVCQSEKCVWSLKLCIMQDNPKRDAVSSYCVGEITSAGVSKHTEWVDTHCDEAGFCSLFAQCAHFWNCQS